MAFTLQSQRRAMGTTRTEGHVRHLRTRIGKGSARSCAVTAPAEEASQDNGVRHKEQGSSQAVVKGGYAVGEACLRTRMLRRTGARRGEMEYIVRRQNRQAKPPWGNEVCRAGLAACQRSPAGPSSGLR